MKPQEAPAETAEVTTADESAPESGWLEYDAWRWHTEGNFPKDQLPEQGYVHIGVFVAWLASHDMLDPDWVARSGVEKAVASMRDRRENVCALRDMTDGRFSSDMLTTEGQGFTGAYYAPEYGYVRDWRKVFGKGADRYKVPDDWQTYDRIEPLVELRYHEWMDAGRPELMPLPRLLNLMLRFVRPRGRKG
ncbi:MAG TPA: hypothetical protein VF375_04860 [Candidatus Limnocylindrales bacterium]